MATPAPLKSSPVAPGLKWNERLGRYIDTRGRIVPAARVRAIVDDEIEAAVARMRRAATQLQAGQINLAQFQLTTEAQVRRLHLATSTAARGGVAQMSAADYGWVGSRVREQYLFLRNFVREIERGLPLDGRFLARVDLYARASRSSEREMERRLARISGATEGKWKLGVADHCAGDGSCVEQARRGWKPLASFPAHGSRICRSNCHCSLGVR